MDKFEDFVNENDPFIDYLEPYERFYVYLTKLLKDKKMKKIIMIAAIALLAVACNKNQAAVKKLDGTWKITSLNSEFDGTQIEAIGLILESGSMTFDGCKLKDDEFCTMTTTLKASALLGGATETDTYLYAVTDDGTKLQQKEDASSTTINVIEIVELTGSTGEFKQTDSDGAVTTIKVEKQ